MKHIYQTIRLKEKILEVSTNLNKIDKAMTNEVIEQMTEFESNKRQREVRKSQRRLNKLRALWKLTILLFITALCFYILKNIFSCFISININKFIRNYYKIFEF